MSEQIDLSKRMLLLLIAGAVLPLAALTPTYAKDGDSGGGGSDDSGGSDGSGSGSGGGSSGDDDDDDSDDDDGSDDGGSGHGSNDHNNARDVVLKGKAISLSKAMGILKKVEPGRVIEVKLVKRSSGFDYRFKVIGTNGKVKTIKMDASTGRIRGFLGL